jgi:glutaminyl-peptide cyclotransferase
MLEKIHLPHHPMKWIYITLLAVSCGLCSCDSRPANLTYEVVSTLSHDTAAYTQGLQLVGGRLYESTGLYGQSSIRELEVGTGKTLRNRPLAKSLFGEGLTLLNNQLYVLTWKEQTAYVFEPENFTPITTHSYSGEGWGLTTDGKQLIMSDGSSTLKYVDPKTFKTLKTVEVTDSGKPVLRINELEWVDGQIFANIYLTDRIARISPESGNVTGWLDLSGLRKLLSGRHRAEVLNGIAYNAKNGHLLVTGKFWPQLFEIKISEN